MKTVLVAISAIVLPMLLPGSVMAGSVDLNLDRMNVTDDAPFIVRQENFSHYSGPDFFTSGAVETIWYGGTQIVGGRPLAVVGGKWTWNAGGWGGIPHSGRYLDGWTSRDMLSDTDEHFRRHDLSDTPCYTTKPPQWGNYVFWCGATTSEANDMCWVAGSGYGENWKQCLENTIYLSGDPVTILEYDYAHDGDTGFSPADWSYVELDTSGTGGWMVLPINGGEGGYFGHESGHESINIGPYITGPRTYGIRFFFASNDLYSDQDGLNPTDCGGLIIDNIKITEGANGVVHFCDAETSDCGWHWIPLFGPGDWVHLEYNPEMPYVDPCLAGDPNGCAVGDSVVTMYDITAPPEAPHHFYQINWIASPVIPIKGTEGEGLPTHIFQFERYAYLPLLDYVFYAWYVRYFPYDCGFGPHWSSWSTNDAAYYTSTPICGPVNFDLSGQVPSCADSVQIVIACYIICEASPWWCGSYVNNKTPFFDNVRFGAAGSPLAPTITTADWDKYLDMFPTDGTLNCGSTANVGVSISSDPTYYSLGDSLDVDGVTCPGSKGMEVWMHWKVTPGPCLNTSSTWFSVFPTGVWNAARMDTAQRGPALTPGTWMGCYHEDDPNYGLASGRWAGEANEIIPDGVLTPGTSVDYYISANYVGDANSFELRNNEPGYTDMPDEFTILPGLSGAPGQWKGEYPCLLYVDDADGLGAQRWVEDALKCVPANWDRYDKRAPTSGMKNGIGRATGYEKGATVVQLQAYSSVLLDALNVYSGSIEIEDTNLFTGWLSGATPGIPRFLALFGDDIARYLNGNATRKAFMNTYMGTTYSSRYYYQTSGNTSWCVDIKDLAGNRIDGGAMLIEGSLRANMCPNNFNIIGVQAGTNGVAECEFSDANPTVHRNVVSNQVVDGSSNVLYRTVFSSYSTARVRSLGCPGGVNGWSFGDSTGICGTPVLKGWQDDVRDKVLWGGGTGTCSRIIGVPGGVNVSSRAVDELKSAYPNPVNPSTSISFSVKTDGKVLLRVFDASGRLVRTLVNSRLMAGGHSVSWDGRSDKGIKLSSGIYFYQIETEGGFKSAKKIVILK